MTTEGLMLPVSISSDAFKIGAGVVCTYNSFFVPLHLQLDLLSPSLITQVIITWF